MVCKPLRSKVIIPFATVTTVFLMNTFHVSAESVWAKGDITKYGIFTKKAIEERGGGMSDFHSAFDKLELLIDKINKGIEWVVYGFNHPNEISMNFLTWIYGTISKVVLTTPTFIFNNSYIKNTSLTFALISISIVTMLTIYESIMQITKQRHTEFKKILKRYFTVACVSGFVPFLFEMGFTFLNKLSAAVLKVSTFINPTSAPLPIELASPSLDTLILFSFDVVLFAMLIPILLQNGRRWWDLMCLAVVAPLAGTAYVFDRHRHYFDSWWSTVKRLSLVQLVYSVFIMLIGIFIFGTRDLVSGWGLIVKLLIVAGGLWRMLNPPRIVTSLTHGEDVTDMYKDYKRGFKDVVDTVTLKRFRPSTAVKDKLLGAFSKVKDKFKK